MTNIRTFDATTYDKHDRQSRTDAFNTLIDQKFGTRRGANTAAATSLGINISNFSQMRAGRISTAHHHIEKLAAMPDYTEDDGELVMTMEGYRVMARLPFSGKDLLERLHTAATGSASKPDDNDINTVIIGALICLADRYSVNRDKFYDDFIAGRAAKATPSTDDENPLS